MDVVTSNPREEKQGDRRREARTSERRSRYVMDVETSNPGEEKKVDSGEEAAAS